MRTDQRIAIAKDLILFLVGVGGIVFQLVTGNVNFALLAVFTAMTGVPGLTYMISLLRGGFGIVSSSSMQVRDSSDSESLP
jgi:hypothetical protein